MEIIINPPNSSVFLNLFGYNLRYYGLILSSAIFIGCILCYQLFLKLKSKEEADFFIDYIPIIAIIGIVGARIFYVIGNLDFYLKNKTEILMINHGGLSVWGAIIFGAISLYLYLKFKKRDIMLHFDFISFALPLCQAIGRFGNYFNQEAFGRPSDFFIKLYVDKAFRPEEFAGYNYFHPTFLYESILDLLIFLVLIFLLKNKNKLKQGTIFYSYIGLYSIARIFVEYIRIDSVAYVFHIPVAGFISLIMLTASLICLKRLYIK